MTTSVAKKSKKTVLKSVASSSSKSESKPNKIAKKDSKSKKSSESKKESSKSESKTVTKESTKKLELFEDDDDEDVDDELVVDEDDDIENSDSSDLDLEEKEKRALKRTEDKNDSDEEEVEEVESGSDEEEEDEDENEDGEASEHSASDDADMEALEESDEDEDDSNTAPATKSAKSKKSDGKTNEQLETIRPAMDLNALKSQMEKNLKLLENWKTLGKKNKSNRSRADILDEVKQHVSLYYGYNDELSEYFLNMFGPSEALAFFESNEKPRPVTLRVNTLKTRKHELAKSLAARGVNVASIGEWCSKEGLKVLDSGSTPIGATPEYLAGHYMVQSASSFIPVLALQPIHMNESILDMCAAPGGKTTHLGQLMKNTGCLYVNELQKPRLSGLSANVHRMGVCNSIIMNYDGKDLREVVGRNKLDRVLLDAPCSGLGIISRDPSIKSKRRLEELESITQLQKELLLTAIDVVDAKSKSGGYIVYSTCSVSVEENEMVINSILKLRNVKLVPFLDSKDCDFGKEGFVSFREHRFDPSLKHTRRYLPHLHNMDGFYVAKLKKTSNEIPVRVKKDRRKENKIVHWGSEKWKTGLADDFAFKESLDEEEGGEKSKKDSKEKDYGEESEDDKDSNKKKTSKSESSSKSAAQTEKEELLAKQMRLFRTGNIKALKKSVEEKDNKKSKKGKGKGKGKGSKGGVKK